MVKEGRCMQRKGAWGYVMAPVTMVTMATLLRDDGHHVAVMDCPAEGTTFRTMLETVPRGAPDLVLVNTSTPTIDDDALAARSLKQRCSPSPTTVLFGIHPSCRPEDALPADGGVDACILGEPELTARALAAALARGEAIDSLSGIARRGGDGRLVVGPPRAPIADLDGLPIPDWSLVDTGNYRLPLNDRRFLLVNTHRGCSRRCTFCNAHAYYGRVPRHRSARHVLREIAEDVERFGIRDFMFWAEDFLVDPGFVHELCDAIVASGLEIRWVCNGRVDEVSAAVVRDLRRAGCWNLALGVESGDPDVLRQIRKQITPDQTRHAVRLAKEAGLQVTGHVIIGFPQDTRETIAETGRFVDSLDLDFVQYYCAMPYPGTELHAEAVANGWLASDDWRRWEHNQSVLTYSRLSATEITGLRRRMMRDWYLAPRRIRATLRNHVRTPAEAWSLVRRAGGFLRWM
jgi:radical SAM superfamily enzyme YgiQ (UPF0313 family)